MHLQKVMAIRTLLELWRQPIEEVDAGQVASTGVVAPSYFRKLHREREWLHRVSLASDFMCNYMSTDVTTSFGYDYILRQVATGQVASTEMVALSCVQKISDKNKLKLIRSRQKIKY